MTELSRSDRSQAHNNKKDATDRRAESDAAIQYEVISDGSDAVTHFCLSPEKEYNGLGYQNLISMVFRLMSFRDDVDASEKPAQLPQTSRKSDASGDPSTSSLSKNPKAHLHAQVHNVSFERRTMSPAIMETWGKSVSFGRS